MSVKATTTVSMSPLSTWWARCSLVSKSAARSAPGAASPAGARAKPFEQLARPGQVGGQLLGVALHGNDKPVVRLDAFHRSVVTPGRLVQARREAGDRLVVEAVHPDVVLACGVAELGAWIDLDRVREVAAAVVADVVVIEMLDQRAAQGDVDDLLTAADAEDRQLLLMRLLEEAQLGLVELAVDRPDLVVLGLAVEGRVDVPTARKQQAVDFGQDGGARREHDRLGSRRLHRLEVRHVVLVAPPGADGDTDPGPVRHLAPGRGRRRADGLQLALDRGQLFRRALHLRALEPVPGRQEPVTAGV